MRNSLTMLCTVIVLALFSAQGAESSKPSEMTEHHGPICNPSGNRKTSGTIHYHARIYHPTYNYFQETMQFPPSNMISVVNYTIILNTTNCCPMVVFKQLANFNESYPRKVYYNQCATYNKREVALYMRDHIYAKVGFPGSGCQTRGTQIVCIGNRTLAASSGKDIHWGLAAFYECNNANNLDIMFDAQIKYTKNFTYTCEPMDIPYCTNRFGYKFTTFPNALGQSSQTDAVKIIALLQKWESVMSCYQHAFALACYAILPECRNGRRILPCYKMCQEGVTSCQDTLDKVVQPIRCGTLLYQNPETCLYMPVQCPILDAPQFGSVLTDGHYLFNVSMYRCDEGYQLQGDAVRQCEASGKWNSTDPTCEPTFTTVSHTTVLISTFVPLILLVVMVIVCVYYKENLKILVLFNRYKPFGRREDEQKKIFIAYSSLDRHDVSEQFVPQLREQLIGWTVRTYQDDFVAGSDILECIKDGVWESQAVLVLLTENFVQSPWCLHEFIEAETRSVIDQTFKLIVIIFARDNQAMPAELLEDLPDSLKRYIRTRIYLTLWEPFFWNKLRQALSK